MSEEESPEYGALFNQPLSKMRQSMYELNPSRRRPVRVPNLMTLGTSHSQLGSASGPRSNRKPRHVINTPQGPRFVPARRNIGIGDQNVNPNPGLGLQQRKGMSKRRTNILDLDTTTGIEPLKSPAVTPEKFHAPLERKARRVQGQIGINLSRRTTYLREFAIHNSAKKQKKEAANATAHNQPLKENTVPNRKSSIITLNSKSDKSSSSAALKRNQIVPMKSSTITRNQAVFAPTLNLPQPSEHRTTTNSSDRQETVLDNITKIPIHPQTVASVQEQNVLKGIALAVAANANDTLNPNTDHFKLLDVDLQNNVKNQQRIQTALDNLHKKKFELEAELLTLTSEYGQKFNEFMEESRKIVKRQANEVISTLAAPVNAVVTKMEKTSPTDVPPINKSPLNEPESQVASVVTTPQTPSRRSLRIAAQSISTDANTEQPSEQKSVKIDRAPVHPETDIDRKIPEEVIESLSPVVALVPDLLPSPHSITRRSQRLAVQSATNTPSEQLVSETVADLPQSEADTTLEMPDSMGDTLGNTDTSSPLTGDLSWNSISPNSLKRNKTLNASTLLIKKSKVQPSAPSTPTTYESDVGNDLPAKASELKSSSSSLKKSNTSVVAKQADVQQSNQKRTVKTRRSIIDYRQLQASFRGLLQTPTQTPMNKSAKKGQHCAMDTPSYISRRVQSQLKLLLDSPQ